MKWLVTICAVVSLILPGCDRAEDAESAPRVIQSEQWPDEPLRVVSMAPNVTEALFELGMGDRVVAVTRYCDWPPEVEDLPRIGGMLDPDYEAMLSMEPDMVVGVVDGADHRVVERLDGAQVAYGFVAMDDLDTVRSGIEELGEWMGRSEEAQTLLSRFDAELEAASAKLNEKVQPGQRALLVFDREPLVVAGPGSYGAEILELAGFENAMSQASGAYPVVDVEKLLSVDPEVVVDVTIDVQGGSAYWERFDAVTAVAEQRVVMIDDPVMMRPGVRIPEALRALHRAIEAP